ncbi:YybH family protein [Flavobacterium capsici]|uniref:Nuclear transport factor 2 family protein n=1 Tax=Flavobacterium capsici TaxID=3075618 RepID=A0AA96J1F0_9FLAO|nr:MULTISPECIES: nuclear transport factor 2 family protein [unclassified Flavobacterium]WNM17775.1 nuclear transport factor 2 family protein [Flavobacterium sp. PMR2A8]WNM21828.1 nuclear transport factor 2 family protein [Flavobacterium sp. PMTSA4]
MKNKITKGIALTLFAILMMACQPKKEEAAPETAAVDTEKIKAEIQAMEDAFAVGLNTGTTDDIVYYAEDAVSYGQNEPPLVGKAAIHDKLRKEAGDGNAKKMKVAFVTNEVHASSDGEQLVELGSYKAADSTGTVLHSGNYMALFKKVDGKYVCTRDMGASDQPKKEESKE